MKVSLVVFLLLICVIASAATSQSGRLRVKVDGEVFQGVDSVDNKAKDFPVVDLKDEKKVLQKEEKNNDDKSSMRVASPNEAHSVDDEGFFQGVDSVDNKAEDAPFGDLKDARKVLQKEENNDDKSSMILDLRGQTHERDATIEERDATIEEWDATIEEQDATIEDLDANAEELLDELHMKELNRRPDLQGDHVVPVLRFAWKFVLLMQASSRSLEKKGKKAEPLVIGSNDFVADHLARHTFLDDAIPKRVAAMQNQYKSQQDSHSQFATLKGVSGSFMSSRAGLHRPRTTGDGLHPPRTTGDGLHPQEMVSLIYEYGVVRRYKKHSKFLFVSLPPLFSISVSPGTNGPKSPRW